MTRFYLEMAGILVIVALAAVLALSKSGDSGTIRAQERVVAAQAVAERALHQARTTLDSNKVLRAASAGYVAQAAEAEAEAVRAQEALRAARSRLNRASVPDTCLDVVNAHREVIVAAEHLAEVRLVELSNMTAAYVTERHRADNAESALVTLQAATSGLSRASTELVRASRPSIWSKLRPKPIFGAVVGVNQNKELTTAVGVGFGVTF